MKIWMMKIDKIIYRDRKPERQRYWSETEREENTRGRDDDIHKEREAKSVRQVYIVCIQEADIDKVTNKEREPEILSKVKCVCVYVCLRRGRQESERVFLCEKNM